MSGGKYVDSEVGLGECVPDSARKECLLLLTPTRNLPTAFLAPALSLLRSTPLSLILLRNGPSGEVKTRQAYFMFSYWEGTRGP